MKLKLLMDVKMPTAIVSIISLPEPSSSKGELIVYSCSGVRGRCCPSIHCVQTSSPLKLLVQSKPYFMWSLLGKGERKFINKYSRSNDQWLPCPYMVKTFKNLLKNQKSFDLETWHVASGTQALQSLYK